MSTTRQFAANRRNAMLATGPRDTSRTRLNATKHGIFSDQVFLGGFGNEEEAQLFQEFTTALRADLAPVGQMEEVLADQIVMLSWRWRRVVAYESGAIRSGTNEALREWEQGQADEQYGQNIYGHRQWERLEEFEASVKELKADLAALEDTNPLEARPQLFPHVFRVARKRYDVLVEDVLGLAKPWTRYSAFSPVDVERVIAETCKQEDIRKEEFWGTLKAMVLERHERKASLLESRLDGSKGVRLLASVPDEGTAQKVQRYEAHFSRLFHRALHELERLQALRRGNDGATPMALDIDISNGHGPG